MNAPKSGIEKLDDALACAEKLKMENEKLRSALQAYCYCRHAVQHCECAKDARAALWRPEK